MSRLKRYLPYLVVAVVAFQLIFFLRACDSWQKSQVRWDARDAAIKRLKTVELASAVTLPDSSLVVLRPPTSIVGDRRASGDLVTYAMVYRRRHDLSRVPMDDRQGGPVAPLIALADKQAEVLATAGFQTVRGSWVAAGDETMHPVTDPDDMAALPVAMAEAHADLRPDVRIRYQHQSDSGGGSGGFTVDLDAPRIVHHRVYFVPQSGATLFVRNSFDTMKSVVESEFFYSDRTLFGVEYPIGSHLTDREPGFHSYREFIEQPD